MRKDYDERFDVLRRWSKDRNHGMPKDSGLVCPICKGNKKMFDVGLHGANFIGYRCDNHIPDKDFRCTSLFMNAIADIYQDREIK